MRQCGGVCSLSDGAPNGSDSKKLRVEEAPPSRVLHIRKLPNEATETEIIALGLPFGKVTNILTLKGKNQVKDPRFKPKLCLLLTPQPAALQMCTAEAWQKAVRSTCVLSCNCCSVFATGPGVPGDGHRGGGHHHGQLLRHRHPARP